MAFVDGRHSTDDADLAHRPAKIRTDKTDGTIPRHLPRANEARAAFAPGSAVHAIQLDVADRQAMAQAADEAERVFGKVHVLCNNAGVGVGGPLRLATYDDWDWVMSVNLGGVINGLQTFLPRMLAHGEEGHIVNTSSAAGLVAHAGLGIYTTTKYAITGLSETLRTELLGTKIGVSILCPGRVNTKIADASGSRPARYAQTGYAETMKAMQKMSLSPVYMEAGTVGDMVLDAIREDRMYIITQREFGDGIRARHAAVEAALPPGPGNPELKAMLTGVNENPIYATGREKAGDK